MCWERAEKAASGVAQVAGTLASGLSVTKSLLRNCFLAGTLVSKYSENNIEQKELVPIEQIKFGDKVWSFNRIINQWEPKPVLETFRTQYDGDIVAISFGKEIINATGGHPIWVLQGNELEHRPLCDCLPVCDQKITPDGRWVYARDLQIGDVVRSRSFGTQEISALELSQTETLVYNFLVDDLHNYCVGENEILVHNTNSPKKYDDFDIGYKGKTRDKQPDKMKLGHSRDKKQTDNVKKSLTQGQAGKFDEILNKEEIAKGNGTVPFKRLKEIAEQIKKDFPNL
jgi:hypothetical protein